MDHLEAIIDASFDHLVDVRRDLHAHPELGFEEHRTTALVNDALVGLGLKEHPVPTATGAMFSLQGRHPGKTVLIRADIDALPITETADVPFASVDNGVMHACGHDAHTAALIGAATALSRITDDLRGTMLFVFQPAEEGVNGARAMLDGGLLDGLAVDAAIGCHVASMFPTGLVGVKAGIMMSDAKSFTIRCTGLGGHGAAAPESGNVIIAISMLASKLFDVVEGLTYEGASCSCTAGMIHAGTAANVIPDTSWLRGTLRTFTGAHATMTHDRLERLCAEVADLCGVDVSFSYDAHTPAVKNDPEMASRVFAAAASVIGDDAVLAMPPVSMSDDMSEFLARIPGCYFGVGAGRSDGTSGMHHNPSFAIDERAIAIAAKVLATAAYELGAQ